MSLKNCKDNEIAALLSRLEPNFYYLALLADSTYLLNATCCKNLQIDGVNRLQDVALPQLIQAQARWALLPPISVKEATKIGITQKDTAGSRPAVG